MRFKCALREEALSDAASFIKIRRALLLTKKTAVPLRFFLRHGALAQSCFADSGCRLSGSDSPNAG